jgi:hypothetical protein
MSASCRVLQAQGGLHHQQALHGAQGLQGKEKGGPMLLDHEKAHRVQETK